VEIDSDTLRLIPQLVPRPLWGLTVKRLVPRKTWEEIRRDALLISGGACVICGARREKGMVCTEEWSYGAGIATLVELRIVCPDCNAARHIGSAARRGTAAFVQAFDHLVRVNRISQEQAMRLVDGCMAEWRASSMREWRVTVADELVARYPALAILSKTLAPRPPA